MEASSTGDKYQITLSKPTAKISNFIPEEIKFIQQQLNSRNRQILEMQQMQRLQQMRAQAANSQQSSQLASANSTSAGSVPQVSPVAQLQSSSTQLTSSSIQLPSSSVQLPSSSLQLPNNPAQLSSSSSSISQLALPQLASQLALPQLQNLPQAAASNIIQQIAQISQARQQPFTGTISLHNSQAKPSLGDLSSQISGNRVGRLLQLAASSSAQSPSGTVSLSNPSGTTSAAHISALNLPLVTAGLSPSQQPKVIHIHHHDTDDHGHHDHVDHANDHSHHSDHSHSDHDHHDHHDHSDHSHSVHVHSPPSALYPNTEQAYHPLNVFESAIQPGSVVSFQSVLSKRKGLSQNEPVIKELPLNRITKYLERKKKKGNDRILNFNLEIFLVPL